MKIPLLNNRKHKGLIENFISLSILNLLNYLFPLILIPFLTRQLGVAKYGNYVFVYAIINYLILLIRYGFDFSATKQIATTRDDQEQLDKIFSSVTTVRFILAIGAIIILSVLIICVPKFAADKFAYLYGTGIFIGLSLTPTWFFQGMEKMKFITIINFIVRLISTILIFLFVTSENDYKLVLLFQSLGSFGGCILSLYFAFYIFRLRFKFPSVREVIDQIKDGWYVFISTIGMNFYRESNIVILGFITNFQIVGYYAAAEKFIKVIQSLSVPFVNTLYPYFGRKLNMDNSSGAFKKYKLVGFYYLGVLFIITVISFLGSGLIPLFLGKEYAHSILTFRILTPVIILGGYNFYFGVLGLINIGKEKIFALYVWICGSISIVLSIILSYFMKEAGAAISMVVVECLLTILLIFPLRNYESTLK